MNYTELRVLLVDDQLVRRTDLRRKVSAQGVGVIHEVGSASEAIGLLHGQNFKIDLVITDLELPDSDGLELIHAVTQDASITKMVVLVDVEAEILSALSNLPKQVNGSRISTVAKPLTDARLVEMLERTQKLRMNAKSEGHRYSLPEIERGIAEGQFVAFLEPQIALDSNLVSGFEALVRWRHPQHGWVSPFAFIQTVETSNLIGLLTLAVLDSALESLAALRLAGYGGGLSINLSARSLVDPYFPALLGEHVRRAGLRHADVMLEITETAHTSDTVAEINGMARLRLMGFHLAIDDFGMGYSSLAKMSQGAFSEVKIDRQFTSRIESDSGSRAAVQSTLALAQSLKWICVAEGIETERVKEALIALGCRTGQGYLFSRPIEPNAVVAWWRNWEESRLLCVSRVLAPARSDPASGDEAILGDERMLATLEQKSQPVWIFDLDRYQMAWANPAALRFWDSRSVAELSRRNFSEDMTPGIRERLDNLRMLLRDGRPMLERWTLYPNAQPKIADCMLTGLFGTNGRASILVEAQAVDQVDTEGQLESAAIRAAGVCAYVFSKEGTIEWRNAFAASCFGVRKSTVQDLFNSPIQAADLLEQAIKLGESHGNALLGTGCGTHLHRVNFRRMRDPGSGREMVSAILMPVGEMATDKTCLLLCNQACPSRTHLINDTRS